MEEKEVLLAPARLCSVGVHGLEKKTRRETTVEERRREDGGVEREWRNDRRGGEESVREEEKEEQELGEEGGEQRVFCFRGRQASRSQQASVFLNHLLYPTRLLLCQCSHPETLRLNTASHICSHVNVSSLLRSFLNKSKPF